MAACQKTSSNQGHLEKQTIDQQTMQSVQNLILKTKEFTIKIANSNMEINSLVQLSDRQLIEKGVFSEFELESYKIQLNSTIDKIKENSRMEQLDYCQSCKYTDVQKIETFQRMVKFAKEQPKEFDNYFDNFSRLASVVDEEEGDGPKCSFAFYVCIGLCSGATSGIGAAACVYLCACSFCELKPPGC